MIPAAVIAEAREWMGTAYSHQRRAKGVACDCLGLVIGVARKLGLVAPDFDVTGYARTPDGWSLMDQCDANMTRVDRKDLVPGHVVVIRWEKDPCHMGILGDYHGGGLSLIHALGTVDGKGRVVEHRMNGTAFRRIVQGYALPGVAY